ncbi:MAG TPA: hypothetical protein VII30_02055 [Gemmatimonadaceae bacterium]
MTKDGTRTSHYDFELPARQELLEQGTVSLSISTFRFVPADLRRRSRADTAVTEYLNELNARIATALRLSGKAFVSNGHIEDRYILRACIVNFRTTLDDVRLLPELIVGIGREIDERIRPKELRGGKR